ncbi:MAG: extracellular solute-binding protein [Dehalococcoidia bacterium]|nr:extracellular solute-binding protein [Dehalococcoidia bacterium]
MRKSLLPTIFVALILIMVSCAPQPAPTLTPPAPRPTTAPVAAPTSNLPPSTSQDAAWAKVVESAKKEGTVTIYSFYYVADIGRAIAKAFQDRYGIRVEILAIAGRQTVEKVKVEASMKQLVADLVNTGVSSATELSVGGFGENIFRELPNLKDRNAFLIDPVYSPNGDMVFASLTMVAPIVNTRLVGPQEEPRSFNDFLDPKWNGHILAADPRAGGGGLFNIITTMKHFKILDDAYWRKLSPQLQLFGGSQQELYRMVARGEYKIGLPASDSAVAPIVAEGGPLKFVSMDEGDVAQGESVMLLKGAPHPNAGKLFMDWILSPEGQEIYARSASTNPLRKGVPGFALPAASVNSKKIVSRTWEAAQAGNDYQKAGLLETLFGKK